MKQKTNIPCIFGSLPVTGSLYSALSMEVLSLSYLILVHLVLLPASVGTSDFDVWHENLKER
jgi:hypothetical protein